MPAARSHGREWRDLMRRAQIAEGYQAGKPFLDHYLPAVLTPGLYHADGQIQDEVYEYGSFQQSRMFAKGLRCSDCHDPHSLKLRAPGNGVCAQCHLPSKYDAPAHHHHQAGSKGAAPVTTRPRRTGTKSRSRRAGADPAPAAAHARGDGRAAAHRDG